MRGYVSQEAARQDYGVVLQPDTLAIDVEEIQRLRLVAEALSSMFISYASGWIRKASCPQTRISKSSKGNRSREKMMNSARVEEIQAAIESLPYQEYVRLRQWFSERDWGEWDRQIEADSESGKLDFLIEEALNEKAKGILKEL